MDDGVFALKLALLLFWTPCADEITLEYEFERTHELLFIAQLASLIAMHVLPGCPSPEEEGVNVAPQQIRNPGTR